MMKRPTAVKLLHPDKAGEANLARFEREVQLTAQLTHPNTITIFDFGRTADGVFYYAMELLDGATLADVVKVGGPLTPGRVVEVLGQVASALEEAHGIDFIHRDIKPGNIILCRQGGKPDVAKLVDFGLVKDLVSPKTGTSARSRQANYEHGSTLALPRATGRNNTQVRGGTSTASLWPSFIWPNWRRSHRVHLYLLRFWRLASHLLFQLVDALNHPDDPPSFRVLFEGKKFPPGMAPAIGEFHLG